jgi:hypothetical protein
MLLGMEYCAFVVYVWSAVGWCRIVSGFEVVGERGGGGSWGGLGWGDGCVSRVSAESRGVFCVGLQASGDVVEGEV